MAGQTIGFRNQKLGTITCPHSGQQTACGFIDRDNIIAVDRAGGKAQAFRSCRRACTTGQGICAGGRGIGIVFTHEQYWQIVHSGPVQTFQKRAAVNRAIAEDTAHDAVALTAQFQGMGCSGSDADIRADHAIGT